MAARQRLADEYALHLPAGSVLWQDLGLLGHAPAGVVAEMLHKKPPKRELTFSQRLYNQLLSPLRVVIEYAYSGIKRLRMVGDTLRLRGEQVRDRVMVVACTTCASLAHTECISPRRTPISITLPNKL